MKRLISIALIAVCVIVYAGERCIKWDGVCCVQKVFK